MGTEISRPTQVARGVVRKVLSQPSLRRWLRRRALRGDVPTGVWKRLPSQPRFRVDVGEQSHFDMAGTIDNVFNRSLYWRGVHHWEAQSLRAFSVLAHHSVAIADVGAYTGVYSLLACAVSPNANITAFEPVERNATEFRKSLRLNSWSDRVALREVAVGSEASTRDFFIPDSPAPTSSHLTSSTYDRSVEGTVEPVPVVRLDDEFGHLDLVKIDVEGSEHEVFSGMKDLLANAAPTILFECLPGAAIDQLHRELDPNRYRYFQIHDHGIVERSRIEPDPHRSACNWLAVARQGHIDLLEGLV